jgi:hypothetical protein
MVIRLVYNPEVEWDVHRFEVSAPSVIRAINMIDAPKEVKDGDLIIHEANSAYLCNQGMLKSISMEEVAKMRPPQKCTNCELSKTALNTCVKADHPGGEIDILFLGMAPGASRDTARPMSASLKTGRPRSRDGSGLRTARVGSTSTRPLKAMRARPSVRLILVSAK